MNKNAQSKSRKSRRSKQPSRSVSSSKDWLLAYDTTEAPVVSTSVSTTAVLNTVLGNLMNQFIAMPSLLQPMMSGGSATTYFYKGRLHFKRWKFRINVVGSQGNALVAGDLFNRLRLVAFKSKESFGEAVNITALTIDSMVDERDIEKIYLDRIVNLPSQAYDTVSSYNVPACKTIEFVVPLNDVIEVYSNAGGTQFYTRSFNYFIAWVSDSSATPYPTVSGSNRLYYKLLP